MWARSRRSANWRRGSSTGPVTHRGLPVRILGAKPFYLFDELFHLCLDVETHPDVRGVVASGLPPRRPHQFEGGLLLRHQLQK